MSATVNTTTKRNRVYVRRFDYDEARRRYQAGESVAALSAEYGVTPPAVSRVVYDQIEEKLEYNRGWRTGKCEVCGGPAMRLVGGKKQHNPDGRTLCNTCRGRVRRERVRFNSRTGRLVAVRCGNVDCANGERWQPPENFPKGTGLKDVREGGVHMRCRACQTRARRDYRERHKIPCTNCGKPRLPASEINGTLKRAHLRDTGLCRDCWRARRELHATGGRF